MRRVLLSLMIAGAAPVAAAAAPADLCAELTAYLDKAAVKPAGAAAAQESAARPAPPPQTAQGGQQGATAVEAAGDRSEPGAGGRDASQRTSGMSGPITEHGVGAAGPQGDAQARSSTGDGNPRSTNQGADQKPNPGPPAKAPAAPGGAAATKPLDPTMVSDARAAASAQDQKACRDATQRLRIAGAVMPAPLLALGALKPELLVSGTPSTPETPLPR